MRAYIFFILVILSLNTAVANEFGNKHSLVKSNFCPKLLASIEIAEPSVSDNVKVIFMLEFKWDFDFIVPDERHHAFIYEQRSKSADEFRMLNQNFNDLQATETLNLSLPNLIDHLSSKEEIKTKLSYFAEAF